MQQVKIFEGNTQEIEDEVNEWLIENNDVEVIQIATDLFSVTILYKLVGINTSVRE